MPQQNTPAEIPIYVAINAKGTICKAIANQEYDHLNYLVDACRLDQDKYGHLTIMPILVADLESVTGKQWEDVDCNMQRIRECEINFQFFDHHIYFSDGRWEFYPSEHSRIIPKQTFTSLWKAIIDLIS